jgi:hypothetical protein
MCRTWQKWCNVLREKAFFARNSWICCQAQKKAFRENRHPKYNDPEFGDLDLGGD